MISIKFQNDLQTYSQPLHAFANRLTNNPEDAKDLYQETAVRALKNWKSFREGTNLKAWLFTIMKNLFINDYRQKSRQNTIFDYTENLYFVNSSKIEIRNEGEGNLMMKELIEILGELDDDYRIPFLMHYEGFKYHEIAEELDAPIGTIKSRIFLARKAMKKSIELRYQNYQKDELMG